MRTLLASALLLCAATPLAAQHHDHAVAGGGRFPAGWHGRLDRPTDDINNVMFMAMGGGFHVNAGVRVILWNPVHEASGNYTVTAAFTQPTAPPRLDGYGIIFGGANLDKDDQAYTYFLIRHDGRFIIKHRDGADSPTIVDWTEHAAVHKPDAAGRSSNTLAVEAGTERIRFLVNGQEVASLERRSVAAANGIAGLRVNHGLEILVDSFRVEKGM
jgi:hypothetical protein